MLISPHEFTIQICQALQFSFLYMSLAISCQVKHTAVP